MHGYTAAFAIIGAVFLISACRQHTYTALSIALVAFGCACTITYSVVWRSLYRDKFLAAVQKLSRGWDPNLADLRSHSLCDRLVLLEASTITGHEATCRAWLKTRRIKTIWFWKWQVQANAVVAKTYARRHPDRPIRLKSGGLPIVIVYTLVLLVIVLALIYKLR